MKQKQIAIIGAGPAGLMAAEELAKAGHDVTIYDAMPTPARKLLIAGRGGLNLTHSEPLDKFISRYGNAASWLEPQIKNFTPTDLCEWSKNIGQETFIGTSGRIFPKSMKAVELLRAWLQKLDKLGVKYKPRHYWQGWEGNQLKFANNATATVDATLLALGGASWPRLGSDGKWTALLADKGIDIADLRPANSGFTLEWTELFKSKFAGTPLKSVALTHNGKTCHGEAMITAKGIEGGAIYAISSALRTSIENTGKAVLEIDLRPNMDAAAIAKKLGKRGNNSFSNFLRKAGFSPVAISLLREVNMHEGDNNQLAQNIKSIKITLTGTTGLERAISSAGGIKLSELDSNLMLKKLPGIFACGEMLDWEAPTGGYLLQACFSSAVHAARGINNYLEEKC